MTPHYSGTTLDAQVWVASFVTLFLFDTMQRSALLVHLCSKAQYTHGCILLLSPELATNQHNAHCM